MNNLTDFIEDTEARTLSFYAKGENVGVSVELIENLKARARNDNARLCLHSGAEDIFHQMLIVEYRGRSFPAHRHPNKSEGYHIIEGEMALQLFDSTGNLDQIILITKSSPIARVGPNTFHCLKVISPYAVYLESKPGPFDRSNDKIMAPWIGSIRDELMEYNRGL